MNFDIDCDCELPPPPKFPMFFEFDKEGASLVDFELCNFNIESSYFSTLQTSILLLATSVLIIFCMLIFLLLWIQKRKIQDSLPQFKSQTVTTDSGQNEWIVMRHNNVQPPRMLRQMMDTNIELMNVKYPLFINTSLGPEPVYLNENIYEECNYSQHISQGQIYYTISSDSGYSGYSDRFNNKQTTSR